MYKIGWGDGLFAPTCPVWESARDHSPFAVLSCTVPVVTTPSVCSNVSRWKQKLMLFNPCHFLSLTAHPCLPDKQPETSPVPLGAHVLSFLLQHAGPSAREGALALASCSFHDVLPLRCWCTDKQDREPRPSTCLPPCFPPFQQPQPAFTAV